MKTIQEKTRLMKLTELRNGGVEIEEVLRRKFVDENKRIPDIARELYISYPVCVNWLKLAGIRSRRIHLG